MRTFAEVEPVLTPLFNSLVWGVPDSPVRATSVMQVLRRLWRRAKYPGGRKNARARWKLRRIFELWVWSARRGEISMPTGTSLEDAILSVRVMQAEVS